MLQINHEARVSSGSERYYGTASISLPVWLVFVDRQPILPFLAKSVRLRRRRERLGQATHAVAFETAAGDLETTNQVPHDVAAKGTLGVFNEPDWGSSDSRRLIESGYTNRFVDDDRSVSRTE